MDSSSFHLHFNFVENIVIYKTRTYMYLVRDISIYEYILKQ